MRHDHLKRELDLLLLLTQNRTYAPDDICQRIGISRRSFYYYIEFFEQAGFRVEKHFGKYCIDRSSPFFERLLDLVQFTEDEALLMKQLITNAGDASPRLRDLHRKLDRFYDFRILEDEQLQQKMARIRSTLYNAVKSHRMVKIVNYSSPSSHTVAQRIVEPFMFLNNNNDIRCYEVSTGKNKIFRLSRMGDVVRLDEEWSHEAEHKKAYIDLFSFSGESTTKVSMVMGQLSHNVMLEEYPASAPCFAMRDDGKWYFETDVCSYLGIGRFVLGMYDDIEVLGDRAFEDYLSMKIKSWNERCAFVKK
jgi:predicted DNA-binding transcriptional regulator YafY